MFPLQLLELRSPKTSLLATCNSDLTPTSLLLSVTQTTPSRTTSFKNVYLKLLPTFWLQLLVCALLPTKWFRFLGPLHSNNAFKFKVTKSYFLTASTVNIPVMTSYAKVGTTLVITTYLLSARSHGAVLLNKTSKLDNKSGFKLNPLLALVTLTRNQVDPLTLITVLCLSTKSRLDQFPLTKVFWSSGWTPTWICFHPILTLWCRNVPTLLEVADKEVNSL